MTKPKLDSFYSIQEFCQTEFIKFLGWRSHQLSVPSEVYIDSPQVCIPIQARAWNTDLYTYEGKILNSNQLAKLPGFRGVSNYPNIILLEVWEDQGCDGHLSYRHTGYIFMDCIYLSDKKYLGDKKYPEDEILRITIYFKDRKYPENEYYEENS